MTYAEAKNKAPINWLKELKPGLSKDDLYRLENFSGTWPTCACGNQCNVIPRHEDDTTNAMEGEPKDPILSVLGYTFHEHISKAGEIILDDSLDEDEQREDCDAAINQARKTFLAIEFRAAELIKQIKNEI